MEPTLGEDADVVFGFDGQTVWKTPGNALLEVGNFLGGGAAGTVYECEHAVTHEHFALKILNPLGFRLVAPALLRKCVVVHKGEVYGDGEKDKEALRKECVWWLMDGGTKQYVAAYYSSRQNCLKDLTLNQCVEIWGHNPSGVSEDAPTPGNPGEMQEIKSSSGSGGVIRVPKVPPKYADFVRRRWRLFREIKNMRKISTHRNVIGLDGVLELSQESKCTIFLVMELANGGELFDRIKIDHGTRESTAKYFFKQLLEGVQHCHRQGVCHRDLKPENLLLQDTDAGTVLKIADFGFSARFALQDMGGGSGSGEREDDGSSEDWKQRNDIKQSEAAASRQMQMQQVVHTSLTPVQPPSYLEEYSAMKVLKSVVGSPFYVAPEVLQAKGYDGPRADIWSLGVILYAMLAGNLPFGQELASCKRFRHFCKWVRDQERKDSRFWEKDELEFPPWLFPANFSVMAKGLIVSMLHPDPTARLTIREAMNHPLCAPEEGEEDEGAWEGEGKGSEDHTPMVEQVEASIVDLQDTATHTQTVDVTVVGAGVNDAAGSQVDTVDSVVDLMAVASVASRGSVSGERGPPYNNDDESGVFQMEEDDGVDTLSDRTSSTNMIRSEPTSSLDLATIDSDSGAVEEQQEHRQLTAHDTPIRHAHFYSAEQGGVGAAASAAFSPPRAPSMLHGSTSIDDLVVDSDDHGSELLHGQPIPAPPAPGTSVHPPEFSDLVKRTTRFLTAVPAVEVLSKVYDVLEDCRVKRIATPMGSIGRVELRWDSFRLEVWGTQPEGPPLCAMQLYEVPETNAYASSPAHNKLVAMVESQMSQQVSSSFGERRSSVGPRQLYMVEFVRENLDIFIFKRFYEWLRLRFSELVKRDAGVNHLL